MRRRKVDYAFVLAGVLLSNAAGPAMADMNRAECIKLFEAKYEIAQNRLPEQNGARASGLLERHQSRTRRPDRRLPRYLTCPRTVIRR